MNILLHSRLSPYSAARIGGAETSIRLMAEKLAQRGHAVSYLSTRQDGGAGLIEQRIGAVDVLQYPNPLRRLPLRVLRRLGLDGVGGIDRRMASALRRRILHQVIAARGIDVLYTHYDMDFAADAIAVRDGMGGETAGGKPFAIALRMSGLRWLDDLARPGTAALKARYRDVFNGVDAINYLSAESRDLAEAEAARIGLGLAPRGAFVADIGVNLGRAPDRWAGGSAAGSEPDSGSDSSGGSLDIVVATRFSAYQKRQDLLVEAVRLLGDAVPVRVTMIGSGETAAAIAARIAEARLGAHITILPFLPQEELWRRLAAADLLAHPCDYEGVSKIILESMMIGLPVLASRVAPVTEYVRHGETGLLADNTPEAWAEALRSVWQDRSRLAALSARARDFVQATYDAGRNVLAYEAAFQDLVVRRRGGR